MSDVGQWLRNTGVLSKDSLRFITSIKYDTSLMKAINNMTFFFDPNWQGDGKTLPLSFFYLKDYNEIMNSEISQKTMLFYNYGEESKDAVKGGLLGVVADNIVNKPKKYKLDVIVPASFSQIDKIYQFDSYSRANILETQLKVDNDASVVPTSISALMSTMTTIVATMLQALVTALTVESTLNSDIITALLTLDTSNKDSLSAMWGNRTILKMKLPNGWKFKYVALEAVNINKKGEDGNFFTGTIEVTELPILTIDKDRTASPISSTQGALMTRTLGNFRTLLDNLEKAFN